MLLSAPPLRLVVICLVAVSSVGGAGWLGIGCRPAAAPVSVFDADAAAPLEAEGVADAVGARQRREPLQLASTPPVPDAAAEPAPPPVILPAEIEVGARASLPVPGDRELLVYAGPAERRLAVVYLHGVCGDVGAVASWVDVVTRRGTLIVLRGDSACSARPGRYAWRAPIPSLARRIDIALALVRDWRGGLLDTDEVILIGYSQGAARAEALARHRPGQFSRVLLASGPAEPDAASLAGAAGVALLGGTEEDTRHLTAGESNLRAAGIRARYFALPGARHGEYGQEAARVMDEALTWLLASALSAPGGVAERHRVTPAAACATL